MNTTAGPSSITLLTTEQLCAFLAGGQLKASEVQHLTGEIVRRAPTPASAPTGEGSDLDAQKALGFVYDHLCAMDNGDEPLEAYPQRVVDVLAGAGWAVVPCALPHKVLGTAAMMGETGNPKLVWDYLIGQTRMYPRTAPDASIAAAYNAHPPTAPAAPAAPQFVEAVRETLRILIDGNLDKGQAITYITESLKNHDRRQRAAAPGDGGGEAEQKLAKAGVFKGAEGLRGLADAQEFWDRQPYSTRLYYGDGIADYLHRGVLRSAIKLLDTPALPSPPACEVGEPSDAALDRAINAWFEDPEETDLSEADRTVVADWRKRMRAAISAARSGGGA